VSLKGPHIIVGLGNPGSAYADTRHNACFRVVDGLAADLGINYWKLTGSALIGEGSYQGDKIVLVKPQSFMNLSGGPVKGAITRMGGRVEPPLTLAPNDLRAGLLVIHDELDLPDGTLRLKIGGGHGGHNGLRSLHEALGSDYARLRVGIGRPPGRMDSADWVLAQMKGAELEEFAVTCAQAVTVAKAAMTDGLVSAMTAYNRDESAAVDAAGAAGAAETSKATGASESSDE
jgi:PTH1 family peptidyl-tRNA hydrolase